MLVGLNIYVNQRLHLFACSFIPSSTRRNTKSMESYFCSGQ